MADRRRAGADPRGPGLRDGGVAGGARRAGGAGRAAAARRADQPDLRGLERDHAPAHRPGGGRRAPQGGRRPGLARRRPVGQGARGRRGERVLREVAAAAGDRGRVGADVVRGVRPAGPAPALRRAVVAPAGAPDVLRDVALAGRDGAPPAVPGPGRRHRRGAVRDGGRVRAGRDAAGRRPRARAVGAAAGGRLLRAGADAGRRAVRRAVDQHATTPTASWPRRCSPATSPGSRRACSTRARAPGRGSHGGSRGRAREESVWRAVR